MNTQISVRYGCFKESALLFLNFVCFALKIVFHSVVFDACILVHVRKVVFRKLASIDTVLNWGRWPCVRFEGETSVCFLTVHIDIDSRTQWGL